MRVGITRSSFDLVERTRELIRIRRKKGKEVRRKKGKEEQKEKGEKG